MSRKVDTVVLLQRWDAGEHDIRQLAVAFQCHKDTVMRILVAAERIQSETEKYLPSRKTEVWTRPCSRCGSEKPRPKGLFFCARCRDSLRREAGGIDDVEFRWPG